MLKQILMHLHCIGVVAEISEIDISKAEYVTENLLNWTLKCHNKNTAEAHFKMEAEVSN